jgi:predicted Rossmann fold nucleotide-binding protein DprA/Smf involved in DNA uptake
MEADHVGCILAIVGSRTFPGVGDWQLRATRLIEEALDVHKPIIVLSGGAIGIDKLAIVIAKAKGYATTEALPKVFTWGGEGGLKDRNVQIATTCQCLVRIYDPASATYGSGFTADEADRQGKHVERYPITNLSAAEVEEQRFQRQLERLKSGRSNYDPTK